MVEWIQQNKEWAFSGIGVTLLVFVICSVSAIWNRWYKKVPIIRVSPAVAGIPGRGTVDLLSIKIANPTDEQLIVEVVYLELMSGERLVFPHDGLTGEPQHKRTILPGDNYVFHIDASKLLEVGKVSTEYRRVQVQQPSGNLLLCSTAELQKAVRHFVGK